MFLAQLDLASPIGDAKRLVPRRVRRGRPTGQRSLCSQPSTEPHVSSDPRHTPDSMLLSQRQSTRVADSDRIRPTWFERQGGSKAGHLENETKEG